MTVVQIAHVYVYNTCVDDDNYSCATENVLILCVFGFGYGNGFRSALRLQANGLPPSHHI